MTRTIAAAALVSSLVLVTGADPAAQSTLTLRIASIVPVRSLWDNALQQMRSDWQRSTNGRVNGRIHSGAVMGDEATVLLKLKSQRLDGSLLTLPGLCQIDEGFNVFGIPLFYASYDELNAVIEQLTPLMQRRLQAKGFVLLHWGHGGWVRVFSTRSVSALSDLKRLKMYTSAGDDRMIRLYQQRGFRPIGLPPTAILTGLTGGLIDALPTTPTAALLSQWYDRARYMLEVPLAPLVGATVITDRAWQSIPEADHAAVLAASHAAQDRLARAIPAQDEEAVREMVRQGLVVVRPGGSDWTTEAEGFAAQMKDMVPDELYAAALNARAAFRHAHGAR